MLNNMSAVYAKQGSENTYYLVDENGNPVDLAGEVVYYPYFYDGRAMESSFPLYTVAKSYFVKSPTCPGCGNMLTSDGYCPLGHPQSQYTKVSL